MKYRKKDEIHTFFRVFTNCLAAVLNIVSFSFSFSCWKIFQSLFIYLRNKTNIFLAILSIEIEMIFIAISI